MGGVLVRANKTSCWQAKSSPLTKNGFYLPSSDNFIFGPTYNPHRAIIPTQVKINTHTHARWKQLTGSWSNFSEWHYVFCYYFKDLNFKFQLNQVNPLDVRSIYLSTAVTHTLLCKLIVCHIFTNVFQLVHISAVKFKVDYGQNIVGHITYWRIRHFGVFREIWHILIFDCALCVPLIWDCEIN